MIVKNEHICTSTLVVFGSLRGNHVDNMKPHDFLNSLEELPISMRIIYVSDENNLWYNKGFEGCKSIGESIYMLEKAISGYTIFMGHSAGGYAAILYGCLMDIERVIAFSPQIISDHHWKGFYPAYDIRELVSRHKGVEVQVVQCRDAAGDSKHIDAIAPFVHVIRLDGCEQHNSAREFVKRGALIDFIIEGKYGRNNR